MITVSVINMSHNYCTLLRLCRRGERIAFGRRIAFVKYYAKQFPVEENKDLNASIEKYRSKILFNSHLDNDKVTMGEVKYHLTMRQREYKETKHKNEMKLTEPLPISLKYLVKPERLLEDQFKNDGISHNENVSKVFHLPYKVGEAYYKQAKVESEWMKNYEYFDDTKLNEKNSADTTISATKILKPEPQEGIRGRRRLSIVRVTKPEKVVNEISDNETHNSEMDEEDMGWRTFYGTPDPSQKISNVPCGGCGALLHCSDAALPGYIPSEIYRRRTIAQLTTIECQRCHFLKEFNVALNMNVPPEEYPRLLTTMQNKKGLVLVLVDLLDFPGSLFPGIFDIIGHNKTVIIVGNKVDLLAQDTEGFLKHIEQSIIDEVKRIAKSSNNIKCVTLISAKTGYGIEELITCMHYFWKDKGDTYLVGCTNVGKSSLFNALLQSDYCKVQAVDLVKRATVSTWPGTTLNMLKFPIQKPTDWRLHIRNKRLLEEKDSLRAEKKLRQTQLKITNHPEYATLMGHIGRTFADEDKYMQTEAATPAYSMAGGYNNTKVKMLNESDHMYADSRWCYDTPGVIQPQQIIKLLTTEELLLTVPKHLLIPRTFYLHSGQTIFLGGLARLDYLESEHPVRLSVFASELLPVTACKTEDADELYEKFVGTEFLTVPKGGQTRLKEWPGLSKLDQEFEVKGIKWWQSTADIAFSSIGWIAVTPGPEHVCKLNVWSPEKIGVTLRDPPILPHAVNIIGTRVRNTPAYRTGHLCKGLLYTPQ